MLHGKRIILGVTGGIAAYKAADILRRLSKEGADVYVVMTANAEKFISPLTFQTLSGHAVSRDMFDPQREQALEHISLARGADLILIAPATANILAKLAAGAADDLLATLCLAARCPILVAPSMNDWMYGNAAVQTNLKTLAGRGIGIIEPETGFLACEAVGTGRLASAEVIIAAVERALGLTEDMAGLSVVITAGPTREHLDPVRFISNRSSGKMGAALARQAARRGAAVTLILGPGTAEPPAGVSCRRVENAADMAKAALAAARKADVFIAAAAVADYTPRRRPATKQRKRPDGLTLALAPTRDILAAVGQWRRRPFLVGFAAQTGDPRAEARRKMAAKNVDLMVANDISRTDSGFDSDDIQVFLLHGREQTALPLLPKDAAADKILDAVLGLLNAPHGSAKD